jgi:hypothetical protein
MALWLAAVSQIFGEDGGALGGKGGHDFGAEAADESDFDLGEPAEGEADGQLCELPEGAVHFGGGAHGGGPASRGGGDRGEGGASGTALPLFVLLPGIYIGSHMVFYLGVVRCI